MPTATEEAAATAAAGWWVDQASGAAADTTQAGAGAAYSVWSAYDAWYDAGLVAQQATEAAGMSQATQDAIAGLFTEYVAQATAELLQSPRIEVPRIGAIVVRNGADLVQVHSRTATAYREAFAFTGDATVALQRALDRAMRLVEDDAMLAARQAQLAAMEQLGIRQYRRVVRPELSDQGPCGLCAVAATRLYRVSQLLPLHGRCKCVTFPVVGGFDPASTLNEEDLKRIYGAAGDSTAAVDLKNVRVQINEHGELGPVITVRGQKFKGPDDLKSKDPGQNARDLKKLLGVLDTLMDRSKSGEDLERPLAYQRARINRLQSTAA